MTTAVIVIVVVIIVDGWTNGFNCFDDEVEEE